MKMSEVMAKTKTTTVEWDGEEVEVSYFPARITPTMLSEVLDMVASAGSGASAEVNSVPALLEPILDWWDVLDDKGKRIPPTAENIRGMPMSFLGAVVQATQEDMKPGNREG